MRKYLQIIKITLEEYFEYRLNFLLWRFRSFVSFLTLFLFWSAIFGQKENLLGYQKQQMLTYLVGIAFLRSLVLGSRSVDLAGQIRSGQLTKLLLQPVGIFDFWFSRDIADKFLNIFFTVFEITIILKIFKFPFCLPQNNLTYLIFSLVAVLAVFLYFFLSFFLSLTGFWTEDVWATRWLFGIIFLEFFAGAFFPIDVLPDWLAKIIYSTPFPYMVYFPLKIWLEQIPISFSFKIVFLSLVWLTLFFWITRLLWAKASKNYGAYGG